MYTIRYSLYVIIEITVTLSFLYSLQFESQCFAVNHAGSNSLCLRDKREQSHSGRARGWQTHHCWCWQASRGKGLLELYCPSMLMTRASKPLDQINNQANDIKISFSYWFNGIAKSKIIHLKGFP